MFFRNYFCSVAILLMLAPFDFAAQAEELNCDDAQTQIDMTQCAARDYEAADTALNAQYDAVRTRYSGNEDARTLLRDAQRAWIGFRDAHCDLETLAVRGGSIEPMMRAQCLQKLTEKRTEELAALAECEEGDLSCL
ncbi:lysozyme inhibitor LprI family protein [Nitratireductor kimnyeongensis]|uniref:Lysozyme inhibitor LprI family protein n=1 Tax=Nitratireductor kimnyeongensis TaxID=430679 RepID=A0ABW0TBR8_9HYPH|nr:lysozyme inhibitor LprI family protein [Nitratireductor kimnyeongensis]QZZ36871.1 lysozyme inhibitor LprI family protein [Nitratireductor kimnyeongensis]